MPWRCGRLCLDTPLRQLVGDVAAQQPMTASERLLWHVAGAREWLERAACGNLVVDGDFFEAPTFNVDLNQPWIVYAEDAESFTTWTSLAPDRLHSGKATISIIADHGPVTSGSIILVERFNVPPRVVSPPWGNRVAEGAKATAHWILLPQLPLLRAYETPTSWGDLWRVAKQMRLDKHLDRAMRSVTEEVRAGSSSSLALLGFRIPEKQGEQPVEVMWQAMDIPDLPKRTFSKEIRWKIDRAHVFGTSSKITWSRTVNVAESHVSIRGALPKDLREASIAIIGVGALGSALAEVLVRMGVDDLLLVDTERFEPQNLRRHLLTIDEVDEPKVDGLARRLNGASFFARVRPIHDAMPSQRVKDALLDRTVVVDCSANNDVVFALGDPLSEAARRFFSFSTSPGAENMYAYAVLARSLDANDVFTQMGTFDEYCRKKLVEMPAMHDLGCHNPAFPAPWDQVLRLATRAVEFMSRQVSDRPIHAVIDA